MATRGSHQRSGREGRSVRGTGSARARAPSNADRSATRGGPEPRSRQGASSVRPRYRPPLLLQTTQSPPFVGTKAGLRGTTRVPPYGGGRSVEALSGFTRTGFSAGRLRSEFSRRRRDRLSPLRSLLYAACRGTALLRRVL